MKGFLPVTAKDDGTLMLLPIDKIIDVQCSTDGTVIVDMFFTHDGNLLGVEVVEPFEEIKIRLRLFAM